MELVYFNILIVTIVIGISINTILSLLLPLLLIPVIYIIRGSNLDTIIEPETKAPPKPPFIKRIVVDDDPDFTLTFKAGLDGYHYGEEKI